MGKKNPPASFNERWARSPWPLCRKESTDPQIPKTNTPRPKKIKKHRPWRWVRGDGNLGRRQCGRWVANGPLGYLALQGQDRTSDFVGGNASRHYHCSCDNNSSSRSCYNRTKLSALNIQRKNPKKNTGIRGTFRSNIFIKIIDFWRAESYGLAPPPEVQKKALHPLPALKFAPGVRQFWGSSSVPPPPPPKLSGLI